MITSISELSDFLSVYHRMWTESPGMDPDVVPSKLPTPLREFYIRLGALTQIEASSDNDYRHPMGTQDCIAEPGGIKTIDGELEFLWENQNCFWVRTAATGDDPEVLSNWLNELGDSDNDHEVVCDSLVHFLITFALQEAVMSSAYRLQSRELTVDQLPGAFQPLWLDGIYVCAEPTHDFHYVPGPEIIAMTLCGTLWLGSNTTDPSILLKTDPKP